MRPAVWAALLWAVLALQLVIGLFAGGWPTWLKVSLLLIGLVASALVYHYEVYRIPTRDRRRSEVPIGRPRRAFHRTGDQVSRAASGGVRAPHQPDAGSEALLHRGTYLRIDFWLGAYTEAELEQEYRIGQGCAGAALERGEPTFYDSIRAHEHRLGLTATQREVTAHVNSILSTPVFRPSAIGHGRPIAVLNLDSTDSIATSGLDEPALRELALYYAETIGAILR